MQQPQSNLKQLNNTLIIVYGPPASGKSTISHQIQRSYQEYHQQSNQKSIVVSADCLEEYLRSNHIDSLRNTLTTQVGIQKVMALKVRRSEFIEQNWKLSRDLLKEIIPELIKEYSLVVIEDDMLLKSQRKYFRHIAQSHQLPYLEISLQCTLEECLQNSKSRRMNEGQQFQLKEEKIRQCYAKLQHQINPYTIALHFTHKILWNNIDQNLQLVKIQHPELAEKPMPNEQNSAKDSVQVQIRKFISEIMINKQLQQKYFQTTDLKQISILLQSIKKSYKSKTKSFPQFLNHFENETYFTN